MSLVWYSLVQAYDPLDQGDLVFNCPVASWQEGSVELAEGGATPSRLKDRVVLSLMDVVVMTQTCDLRHRKVSYVILCPHHPLAAYREAWEEDQTRRGQNATSRSWCRHLDDVIAGQVWNLSVLNSEEGEGYKADLRIVDFHEVFSLPRDFLESWLTKEGKDRIRLLPPYREHLSQAFARFFMRVGLPTEIHKDG